MSHMTQLLGILSDLEDVERKMVSLISENKMLTDKLAKAEAALEFCAELNDWGASTHAERTLADIRSDK